MKNNKIATLMLSSILTTLSTNPANAEHICNDASIHESKIPLVRDFMTCGQCKQPKKVDDLK